MGVVIALVTSVKAFEIYDLEVILIAFLCGTATACFTVSWLMSVSSVAYMMVEVFVMGGVFVPLILCHFLYGEHINHIQITAMTMLVTAVYLMCTSGKRIRGKITFKNILLLTVCALSSGMSDFSQKLYIKEVENVDIVLFNVYTYLFASFVLLAVYFIFKSKEKSELSSPTTVIKPIFHYILIMAGCLFLNSYFKTLSSKYLDAVLLYPLNQGLAVVFSLIMSVVLFKEKINLTGILGVILALVSIILINAF